MSKVNNKIIRAMLIDVLFALSNIQRISVVFLSIALKIYIPTGLLFLGLNQ